MAIIPDFFLNAVVALGIDGGDGKKHWIGTGFIIGRKEIDNPNLSTYYIITNKHVIEQQKYVYVRFNSLGGELVKDYRISLYDSMGVPMFSAHPHDKTDIIALQILPQTLINDKSIWGAFDLADHALTLEQMQNTGVNEGSLVYALGFPMDLVAPIKVPICRLGCILVKKGYSNISGRCTNLPWKFWWSYREQAGTYIYWWNAEQYQCKPYRYSERVHSLQRNAL